jgi:hypothetical protein
MALKEVLGNRNAVSSLRVLPAVKFQFSNRQLPLLEPRVSHSKQRIAIGPNRQSFGGPAFLMKACTAL